MVRYSGRYSCRYVRIQLDTLGYSIQRDTEDLLQNG